MSATAELTVLGARGSIPVAGAEFARYGGHTTAFALAVGSDLVGVVDAGTGIIRLQDHAAGLSRGVPHLPGHLGATAAGAAFASGNPELIEEFAAAHPDRVVEVLEVSRDTMVGHGAALDLVDDDLVAAPLVRLVDDVHAVG